MKFTGFFWDFDGTLFDTYPRINRAMQKAFAEIGMQVSIEQLIPLTKVSLPHTAQTLAGERAKEVLLAYNAHFDLSFLFYMLLRDGDPAVLKGKDKLDLLTVYRDRHSYPHRLCSAIEVYGLSGKVVNSHRAVDDVLATVAVMEEMEKEKDDLERYVNLFGYNPKYGIEGKPISSITYKPQPYNPVKPLYEA